MQGSPAARSWTIKPPLKKTYTSFPVKYGRNRRSLGSTSFGRKSVVLVCPENGRTAIKHPFSAWFPPRNKATLCVYSIRSTPTILTPAMWRSPWSFFKAVSYTHLDVYKRQILDWSSAEIWLYIYTHKLPINEAYKKGNARAGCLLCPMGCLLYTSFSYVELTELSHPTRK